MSKYYEVHHENGMHGWPGERETLTAEGEAYFMRTHRMPPRDDSDDARADAELVETTVIDQGGRPIRTFSYNSKDPFVRKDWLDAHRAPLQRVLGWNTANADKRSFQMKCARKDAERQALEQAIAGKAPMPVFSIEESRAALGESGYLYGA